MSNVIADVTNENAAPTKLISPKGINKIPKIIAATRAIIEILNNCF